LHRARRGRVYREQIVPSTDHFSDQCLDRGSAQENGFRCDAKASRDRGTAFQASLLLISHESRKVPAARQEPAREWRDVLDDVGDRQIGARRRRESRHVPNGSVIILGDAEEQISEFSHVGLVGRRASTCRCSGLSATAAEFVAVTLTMRRGVCIIVRSKEVLEQAVP
jgi:hypothetical protein